MSVCGMIADESVMQPFRIALPIGSGILRRIEAMEIFKASIKNVVLLAKGKWGIVVDFVLEESKLAGKEVLIDYDEVDDLNETGDGCLMIETFEVPWVRRGDTIKITIRDRARK
jgi:hypothetical protein